MNSFRRQRPVMCPFDYLVFVRKIIKNFIGYIKLNVLAYSPSVNGFPFLTIAKDPTKLAKSSCKREALKFKRTYDDYRCILDESYFRSRNQNILRPALHWDFNLFSLERLTAGFPLLHMATYLFEKSKFLQKFELDFFEMQRAFKAIEDLYHETNPYHNALHATDVAQASYCLLKELRGSLLENHHANVSIAIFSRTQVFKGFSPRRWRSLTLTIKTLILATDITRQSELLQRFESFNKAKDVKKEVEEYKWTSEDVLLVQQIAIKCADISNPCRSWEVCSLWASFITEEFFKQGDREKRLNLPVLPTMDREKTTKAKVQIGKFHPPPFGFYESSQSTASRYRNV
ncbi:unnamed protein product [Dibothriocephalus latus]|uniref:PDEase domain-containing protein n=1 Tax=Dibothriocephalus latus TaxID=60516 RepID=A0A3P7L5G0_DIBLA|nr:unnamed protein product [Dibothriocephalus latus]